MDPDPTMEPQTHAVRRRAILQRHPEVRGLTGPRAVSAAIIVALVLLQLGLGTLAVGRPLWLVLLAAYVVGAVISHALYVLIHECTHNLVLRSSRGNRLMGIVANLPQVLPSAMPFRKYHLLHHAHLGETERDPDVPSSWESRWVGRSALRKALWLSLFSISQALRPARIAGVKLWDAWTVANLTIVLAVNVVVYVAVGPEALLFMAASTFFALGLHPLGGRWIQEHFVTEPGQETYSYYGWGNVIALNMGYHNEHHDIVNVPWMNLPKLKRLAPEFYDSLKCYRSWTGVVVRFLFDPALSPSSRITRQSK